MIDFKIPLYYKDGFLQNRDTMFESLNKRDDKPKAHEVVPVVSIVGGVEMALFHFPSKFQINGVLYVASKDSKITIDYDITPVEAIPQLEQAVAKWYKTIETK